jgi:lysophospholipase L1-like esterase
MDKPAPPQSPLRGKDHRICFVGDSFVQGTGDTRCLGWPGRLAQQAIASGTNLTHYNLGIRRDTSRDIAARWQQECTARLPAIFEQHLVFAFGVNDTAFVESRLRVHPEESLANFSAIIAAASTQFPTLVIGPPPVPNAEQNRRVQNLDRQFHQLAVDLHISYLSVFDDLLEDPHWISEAVANDGIHPGPHGYDALAALVQAWPQWWFR